MFRSSFKALSLLVALLLVFSVAACTPTSPVVATQKPADSAGTAKTDEITAPVIADLPFVTISHYALGDPPASGAVDRVQAEWNKLLKERVNAELIQHWINWTDYLAKYNLTLASGDTSVDLIETSSTWLEMWQNADRGAFAKLDDLLPVYAPKTWAEISQEDWDRCRFKGDIIAFPENDYTQYVNHGIMYRGDWAVQAGLPAQFTTLAEFEQYADWIKANKPGVYPIDTDKGLAFFPNWVAMYTENISVLGFGTGTIGLVFAKSLEDPYTAVAPVFEDVFVKFAQDMKTWSDKGYWREDALNNTGSLRDSLKAGTSGVDLHHVQTFRGLKWEMDNEFFPGESDLRMLLWSDLDNGELIGEPITHGALSVYAYSKNPERAVMIYEEIRQSQDMYRLFNFGIEGVQYTVNEKNQKAQPDTYDKGKDEYFINFWGGRVDRFELGSTREWEGIYDYWKVLDTQVKPNPYSQFVFDKSGIDAQLSAVTAVSTELGPMISLGKVKDPVAAVEDFRNRVKSAGFDALFAYCQDQLTAYKAEMEK